MTTSTKTASIEIDGRKWVYEYAEMECQTHPGAFWQTEAQLQANLDAIKAVKEAAAKLKKAVP